MQNKVKKENYKLIDFRNMTCEYGEIGRHV